MSKDAQAPGPPAVASGPVSTSTIGARVVPGWWRLVPLAVVLGLAFLGWRIHATVERAMMSKLSDELETLLRLRERHPFGVRITTVSREGDARLLKESETSVVGFAAFRASIVDTPGIDEVSAPARARLAARVALQAELVLFVLDGTSAAWNSRPSMHCSRAESLFRRC